MLSDLSTLSHLTSERTLRRDLIIPDSSDSSERERYLCPVLFSSLEPRDMPVTTVISSPAWSARMQRVDGVPGVQE